MDDSSRIPIRYRAAIGAPTTRSDRTVAQRVLENTARIRGTGIRAGLPDAESRPGTPDEEITLRPRCHFTLVERSILNSNGPVRLFGSETDCKYEDIFFPRLG